MYIFKQELSYLGVKFSHKGVKMTNNTITRIAVTKDIAKRLKIVSRLRGNKETQGALIGNLVDQELKRVGYIYKGPFHDDK